MIETVVDKINTNKFFIGFMMIILTIGGRFIINNLTNEQKEKIDTPFFRKLFIFCSFFMATRDIITTVILTTAFLIFLESINFEDESFKNIQEVKDVGNLGFNFKYNEEKEELSKTY